MSFAFNVDFEDFLKSDKENYKYTSSKQTQEFEYFILWLESSPLYTTKSYHPEYLNFIKKFNPFQLTSSNANLKMWICDIYDKEEQKKLNSKMATSSFAIENKLAHPKTTIELEKSHFEQGYIYKEEFGVSGVGISKSSPSYERLEFPVVKEPLLNRTFDFSALFYGDKTLIYQNHIDDSFHYKGTTLGLNFEYFDWIEEYKVKIQLIKDQFYTGHNPMSIDSFIYEEDGKEQVYILSEVNNRKTMGYCALMLKDKLGGDYRYARLRLFNSKKLRKKFSHNDLYNYFDKKIIPLSPIDNLFVTFLILEDSLGELNELEDLLVSTFFKDL